MRLPSTLSARLAALAMIVGATMAMTSASAGAASCATPVERAACDILEAKDRANRAAQALEDAETELDNLSVKLATLEEDAAAVEAEVNSMRVGVEELALQRFLGAGSGAGLFTGLDGPTEQVEADALGRFATDTAETSIDTYEAAKADLDKLLAELAQVQADTEQAKETFEVMRQRALDDMKAYQQAYEKAVKDEAVKRALEAQQAERRRQEKEKQEREAAEAARLLEIQRQQQQNAANQPQPGGNSGGGGSSSGDSGGGSGGGSSGGSGGGDSSGGSSGGSDSGGSSSGGGGTSGGGNSGGGSGNSGGGGGGYVADITCPVDGPNAYGDTWGAPRSGGRRHEGVDMISPTGTNLVAVTSGYVQFKETRLGGLSVWVTGNDGNRYFYAHLNDFVGESRNVERGELIGHVGDTGNARGTPHLHFEVHPGGGAAVNPTPSVRAAGC